MFKVSTDSPLANSLPLIVHNSHGHRVMQCHAMAIVVRLSDREGHSSTFRLFGFR